ncbi:MAG TPA: hypothetical protein VKZ65_00045 [Glycomyces sp.]|nr:hypothetical protein [Glycomyces sp.]
MALTLGSSPRFKAPWPEWRVTLRAGARAAPDDGILRLRLGHCRGPETRTPAERMETLSRRRRAGDPVATGGNLRSGLVPVVLVDGEHRASGWGPIDLPLAPGRHLVEIQSQHSRSWRAVDIEPGRATRLDYIGMLGEHHRAYATGEVRGALADMHGHTLGPRGRLHYRQYLPANARSRGGFIVLLACLAAAAPLTWIAASAGAPETLAIPLGAALWLGALAAWAVRVLWTHLRYNRVGPEAPLDTGAFAPAGTAAPLVLDPDGPPPEPAPGSAALLIDARFLKADLTSDELALQLPQGQSGLPRAQRRRLDAIGELAPIRHRSAVPPPEIELDGVPLVSSWTRMWTATTPGRHRLRVRTPAAPLPVPAGQAPPQVREIEVTAVAGRTVPIALTVTVEAVPDPAEPLLHRWECRIERLTSEAEETPPAAPKADVRGGLRRAATGRWWDRPDR